MSQIETHYDEFVTEFGKNLEKVDPTLALKTVYFQKKFTDTKPKVDLVIAYRKGIDLERKRLELDKYFACMSSTYVKKQIGVPDFENSLRVECLADLDTIQKISRDQDVEYITGKASIASYGQ